MSTLRVTNIKNESSPSGGLEIDSSGHVQIDGQQMPSTGPLSNRNLIINGAMQVAQRAGIVTSVTTEGYRTCDRWKLGLNALGTWDVDQATDAPEGFTKSFKLTCTTADASPAAADVILLVQNIEAQNLQHLKYGTSNAENLTLSFWVKSNKTGNASLDLIQRDNSDRQFTTQYQINSADTWEYKTITIPGDTAGLINDDNGVGFQISWWLNSGSNFTTGTHSATWEAADDTNRNVTNLGVGGAISDYFAITGVQLELGDVATPFEHRSYGQEVSLCQRYYQSGNYFNNNGDGVLSVPFIQQMREPPAMTVNERTTITGSAAGTAHYTNTNIGNTATAFTVYNTNTSNLIGCDWYADAEL